MTTPPPPPPANKFLLVWGALLLLALVHADLYGVNSTEIDQLDHIPRTVRDNPGSYRSHYHEHYTGGK